MLHLDKKNRARGSLERLFDGTVTKINIHTPAACYSIYFRGEAYLAAGLGAQASAEFQKTLDHPQLTLTDPVSAMALLGLARAYEISGDRPKSLTAFRNFQNLWKDADPGLSPYP